MTTEFEEYVDSNYDEIKIGPASWYASEVWQAMDPTGYACAEVAYFRDREVSHA